MDAAEMVTVRTVCGCTVTESSEILMDWGMNFPVGGHAVNSAVSAMISDLERNFNALATIKPPNLLIWS
jgi:hypothetical protein